MAKLPDELEADTAVKGAVIDNAALDGIRAERAVLEGLWSIEAGGPHQSA